VSFLSTPIDQNIISTTDCLNFIAEICADSFMVRILNISETQYGDLFRDNLTKQCLDEKIVAGELLARQKFLFGQEGDDDLSSTSYASYLTILNGQKAKTKITKSIDWMMNDAQESITSLKQEYQVFQNKNNLEDLNKFSNEIELIDKLIRRKK
jgi:hypothetical protein